MAISPARPRSADANLSRLYHALVHAQDIPVLGEIEDYGEFAEIANALHTARLDKGTPGVHALMKSWGNRKQLPSEYKRALAAIAGAPIMPETPLASKQETRVEVTRDEQLYPPLPDELIVTPDMTRGLCPLKDQYVAYSREASPEGYEGFHHTCFWGMLSTVAGRRIAADLTKSRYTPLIIVLAAESTFYAKTETAEVQRDVLKVAGLDWLLGLTRVTPQKLALDMAGPVPENYGELAFEEQQDLKRRLAMSAQRGWHYNEFGELLSAMVRDTGAMADFVGLLLQISDCPDILPTGTISRGNEIVKNPYLSITGTLTPASIQTVAEKHSKLWGKGLFARFLFSCPPPNTYLDNPFKRGRITPPASLAHGLRAWHERLGVPEIDIVSISNGEGEPTGRFKKVWNRELPETTYALSDAAYDAWAAYRSALKKLAMKSESRDLIPSYGRLPDTALRIAVMAASLEGASQIEYKHWLLGQEQAEYGRESLHQVYAQVNGGNQVSPKETLEDKVIEHISFLQDKQGTDPTARELAKYLHMDTAKIEPILQSLVRNGVVEKVHAGKTSRYKVIEENE